MAFIYNELKNIFTGDEWNSPTSGSINFGGTTGPITVTQDGVIQNTSYDALHLIGGFYTITVNGQISTSSAHAGLFMSSPVSTGVMKVTVGQTGYIYGGNAGVYSDSTLNLTNAGTIGSGGQGLNAAAIFLDGDATETLTVVNTGTIWTSDATTHKAIYTTGLGARTITNSGDIYGSLFMYGGTQKITNSVSGWIGGDLDLDAGLDTITNAGKIDGNVSTHGGNDVLTNSGTIGGFVDLGAGANKFTNTGFVNGSNGAGTSVVFLGDADTMTNSGRIAGNVSLGNGANSLTNSGTITGFVEAGGDNDKITNSKVIDGYVVLGFGDNQLTNSGTIGGYVIGATGIDKVTNSGTIVDNVFLGDGANNLTNSGKINGFVLSGIDIDTITNSGTISGSVRTNDANDVVKNSGTILGLVDLGTGDDSFTGGNFVDVLFDHDGKDTYALAGGDDVFNATRFDTLGISDGLGDKVDGGANTAVNFARGLFGDIYDASASLSYIDINADGVVHTDADDSYISVGGSLAAGTANGVGVGIDKISNFETFYGSQNTDIIFGGAIANAIFGGNGGDHLHGGAGNDWIDGGSAGDEISGDAGADRLFGDSGADDFIYHKLSDSTVGKLGRDVIIDFVNGEDQIDLSAFLLPTHMNNAVPFVSTGIVDSGFDGMVGAIRVLTNTEGWLVQYDSTGDKKADLSIQVNDLFHVMTGEWDSTDFIF